MPHQAIFHSTAEPFIILNSIDSTNNYAMRQVHAGAAKHGMAYFSFEQTAGKGQRGKQWESTPGQNIILSIIVEPRLLSITKPFVLSASIALACYDLFNFYAGAETTIKWPNDLYWRDRKAGGILIENVISGSVWNYAVAGIGININQVEFATHLLNPVSLKQITGKHFDVLETAKKLCGFIEQRCTAPDETNVLKTYNEVLYKCGEVVRLKKGNIVFDTVVHAVSGDGQLHTKDVTDRQFQFGEVEWII